MSIDRANIIRGPGVCKSASVTLHDADGISSDFVVETAPVNSSMYGQLDSLIASRYATTSFTPNGAISAGILAFLYPYQTPDIGASLFGAADVPFIVHSKAGQKVTFPNGALFSPPNLRFQAAGTAFSSRAQIRHVLKNATAPDAAGAYFAIAAEAFAAATYPLSAASIKGGSVVATLGATAIKSTTGFELAVQLGFDPVLSDGEGVVDYTLKSVAASITFTPAAGTEAALLGMMPLDQVDIGASARSANDFTLVSDNGITAKIFGAHLLQGPLRWGNTTLRQGQLAFASLIKVTTDVPGKVYELTLAT